MDDTPLPQHMKALDRANKVRLARAELKRDIAAGRRTVADVIREVPWEAETMTVADLLGAQHRWARTRTRRFLASLPMSETKIVVAMTARQRDQFAARLLGLPVGYGFEHALELVHVDPSPDGADVEAALRSYCPLCSAAPGHPCMTISRPQPWRIVVTDTQRAKPHDERPRG